MQISAWKFFSFWSLAGVGSFYLGVEALDKTDFSTSISPFAMFIFKHSLALCICHSSNYALVFRPKLNEDISVEKYYIWISFAVFPLLFIRICGESYAWYFPIYSLINLFILFRFIGEMKSILMEQNRFLWSILAALYPLFYYISRGDSVAWYFPMYMMNSVIVFQIKYAAVSGEQSGLLVHYAAVSWMSLAGGETAYSPVLVLLLSFFTAAAWAAVSGDERCRRWAPPAALENGVMLKLWEVVRKNGKMVEFGVGMAGTILFQSFFRLTSFDHVAAFVYFAAAWVANLGLLLCRRDFGVFNFLLGNVIVGCTVSQFGVRGTTWIAYGACLALYALRLKMEDLTVVDGGEDEGAVVVWREIGLLTSSGYVLVQ